MEKNKNKYILYIVKEGDTLESIADKYSTNVKSIMKVNDLDENSSIYVGMNLYIKKEKTVIIPLWLLFLAILTLISGTSYLTFMVFRNSDYLYPNGGSHNANPGNTGNNGNSGNINGGTTINPVPTTISNLGTVVFSFNEEDNIINIPNAYPLTDTAGKAQKGADEYFQFSVAFKFNKTKKDVVYEINLEPIKVDKNPLDQKYVKVYLEENGSAAEGFENTVPTFDQLKNSEVRSGSKVLYSKNINDDSNNSYVLKLWVSEKYSVDQTARVFKCRINVDGYIKEG